MAEWIDAQGGEVRSTDGRLAVRVPAGAWQGRRQVDLRELGDAGQIASGGRTVRPIRHLSLTVKDAAGQEDPTPFAQPVTLALDVGGVDVRRQVVPHLAFYWRDPIKGAWEEVPTAFDRRAMTLSAQLGHFSEYAAGVSGDASILPTVDGFSVDLCHGNAALSIPLKVPPGPHGFQPALTLTYS